MRLAPYPTYEGIGFCRADKRQRIREQPAAEWLPKILIILIAATA